MDTKSYIGALDTETNRYIIPSNAEKGKLYKCADCQQRVILRKGDLRRAHFAHFSPTNTCSYFEHPNESQMHKDAKYKLAEHLNRKTPIFFYNMCPKPMCGMGPAVFDKFEIEYKEGDNAVVEFRDRNNKWVADIALINQGNIRYIFEVKHTHSTVTNVRPEPWFEITTEEIFEEEERINKNEPGDNLGKSIYLTCIRTGSNRWCDNCRTLSEQWTDNLPRLVNKVGMEGMWKQEKPCIICKREKYNPVFVKGPRQLCKLCLSPSYEELKKKYSFNTPMFLDD